MSIEKLKPEKPLKLTDDRLFDFKTSNELTLANAGTEDDNHKFPAGGFNAWVCASMKQFSEEKKDDHKYARDLLRGSLKNL
ncbi:MAG TPA: hypothetical protein ENI67_05195 [Gammaproteobacteria bacterium]|nr:hypothetical protein [Gammaproteobacteria bacterium]